MDKEKIFCRVILFSLFSLLIWSCESKSEKADDIREKYTLEPIKTDSIALDSLTSPQGNSLCWVDSKDERSPILLFFNRKINALYFIDWKSRVTLKKIIFPVEGPGGIPAGAYITANSLDSIFIISNYHFRMTMVNRKGEIIKKFQLFPSQAKLDNLNLGPVGASSLLVFAGYSSPPLHIGDAMYCTGEPFGIKRYEDKDYYEKSRLCLKLHLTNEIINYFMPYPDLYKVNKYYPVQARMPSMSYNNLNRQFITSFPYDNNLTISDLDGNILKKVLVEGGGFEVPDPMPAHNAYSAEKDYLHYINNSHISKVVHDPYRDVYYCFLSIHESGKEFTMESQVWQYVEKIVILNKNFKNLGEVELGSDYAQPYTYVSKEGLYIQKLSPNEDYMHFTLFRLVKNSGE